MQFIAFGPYWAVVSSELEAVYDSKDRLTRPKRRRQFAKFETGVAPAWTWPIALERFDVSKIPAGSSIQKEVGFYDSVLEQQRMGWTDEEREQIEQALLTRAQVVPVEPEKAALPYAKYPAHRQIHGRRTLELVLADITGAIEAAGVDPQKIVAYENDHRDENSDQVIAAMEALAAAEPEEELVEA